MKKIYNAPVSKVVKIQLIKMIALSYGGNAAVNGIGTADSRRNSFWDDEDDWDD